MLVEAKGEEKGTQRVVCSSVFIPTLISHLLCQLNFFNVANSSSSSLLMHGLREIHGAQNYKYIHTSYIFSMLNCFNCWPSWKVPLPTTPDHVDIPKSPFPISTCNCCFLWLLTIPTCKSNVIKKKKLTFFWPEIYVKTIFEQFWHFYLFRSNLSVSYNAQVNSSIKR